MFSWKPVVISLVHVRLRRREMQHAPAPPPPLSASAHLCPSSRSASTGEHGSLSELSGTMGHARRGKWRTEDEQRVEDVCERGRACGALRGGDVAGTTGYN